MTHIPPLPSEQNPFFHSLEDNLSVNKDPWLAANLSMFFPGIGQFYAGKSSKGFIFLIAQIILLIAGFWSIFAANGHPLSGLITLLLAGVLYLFNVLDAHLSVYHDQKHEIKEKIPRKHKNPWFAVFASRILPGLGHFYLKRSFLGLIFLTLSLVFLQLNNFFQALLFVVPLLAAIATYDTYCTFCTASRKTPTSQRSFVAMMAGFVFFSGLISVYLPNWLNQHFEQFIIPSPSMVPTLQSGDRIFVSENKNYKAKRGDIVVFQPPEALQEFDITASDFFIKRVIGLPNDTVEVHQGQVYINGNPLNEPYIAEIPNYEVKTITIPPHHYFVLGDNRNNSIDSHFWGFLKEELIFGKAYKIYWPFNRVKSLNLT
ncbi:MAG: signal peptidase I [Microcystaceae cyanobacterium]